MIGTTSSREVLETMGIVESFNTVIHVPSLSSTGQLTEVLQVSLHVVFLYIWIIPDIKYTMIDELNDKHGRTGW